MLRSPRLSTISRLVLTLSSCLGIGWCQQTQPKLIDCHVHHNGSPEFLDKLVAKLDTLQGMALLIVETKDLNSVTDYMKRHPNHLIGLGQLDLDSPDVVATVDRFHAAGFRGLGEMSKPK